MTRPPAVLALAAEGAAWRVGIVTRDALAGAAHLAGKDGVAAASEALITDGLRRGLDLAGVALASSSGRVDADLAGRLEARLRLPVLRVRRADAVRDGERLGGAARGVANVLVLDADGPDASLLLDGCPRAGAHGSAGDVAHLGLDRTGPVPCSCGRRGCLGALLTAGEAAPEPPRPAGSPPARTRALGWLAVAGIALTNILNPAVLVLAGSAAGRDDDVEQFARTVRAGSLATTAAGLSAVVAAAPEAALIGAAAFVAARADG